MKKLSRFLALVIAVCMIMAFASCNRPDEGGGTTTDNKTNAPSDSKTNEPTGSKEVPSESESGTEATPPESDSESDSETEPGPEPQNIPDGTMIYFEDFDSYGDKLDTESALAALRANGLWKMDTADAPFYETSGPYASVHTTNYTIENGRLVLRNHKTAGGEDIAGKDSYMVIVDENTLWELDGKDYTIQYDVKYESAGNGNRYIALLWNYWGQYYHSFHFRIAGNANLQTHAGSWYTMDMYDPATDLYAAGNDTEEKGSSIAKKLLGKTFDENVYAFENVDLTIKIQIRADDGPVVWMRVNSGAPADATVSEGFVKVSEMVPGTAGYGYWNTFNDLCHGGSLALKAGTTINGSVDNIMIWSGLGDEPADHMVTFQPTPLQ